MKLISLTIGLLLMLSSCVHVYFSEPQPKGGKRQSEIPKELYGTWFGETEGFQFSEKGYTNINIKTDSVGTIIDTTYQTTCLSDTFRIYKAKELYVIHSKENSDYWEIVILKPMKNGNINTYHTSDPKIFVHDKGLKLEEVNYLIDDELQSFKTLDLDQFDTLSFQNAMFSGQMNIKTLRKVIVPDNLMNIFKKDGSLYLPEENFPETDFQN